MNGISLILIAAGLYSMFWFIRRSRPATYPKKGFNINRDYTQFVNTKENERR